MGTATRESDGSVFSWAATVTITRAIAASLPRSPAARPQSDLQAAHHRARRYQPDPPPGDSLLLTIRPTRLVSNCPSIFSTLPSVASTQCQLDQNTMYGDAEFCIPDSSNLSGAMLVRSRGSPCLPASLPEGARHTPSLTRHHERSALPRAVSGRHFSKYGNRNRVCAFVLKRLSVGSTSPTRSERAWTRAGRRRSPFSRASSAREKRRS